MQTIEKFWYSKSALRWLLLPLSVAIQFISECKYYWYQLTGLNQPKTDTPVIVVGNITVGGTGKTPFIYFLAQRLKAQGLSVGIVSRGYQSKADQYPHLVSDKDDVETVGDEAYMQYQNLKVPMAIGADRQAAVNLLNAKHRLDLVISDDGMQHYRMRRNIEILMVDGQRLFGNHLMLPFGPLREPVSRCNRTDFVIVNGVKKTNRYLTQINKPLAHIQLAATHLIHLATGEPADFSLLTQSSVTAVAAIGNPQRFFDSLTQFKKQFTIRIFSDHHQFMVKDFEQIDSDIVVMTEKDAVKCRHFARQNWYYLAVEAWMDEKECNQLMQLINQKLNFKSANKNSVKNSTITGSNLGVSTKSISKD